MTGTDSAATARAAAYLPSLDGLRAVSILLVVLSHLGLDRVVPGAFGVTLFFFISGYLITRQLLGGLAASGRIDLAGFYMRRALRLMPAGAAYILLAGAAFALAGGHLPPAAWAAAALYGANYYDLWAGFHSTLPGVRHPFNILWSLAVEEHFYLLWPLALLALYRRRHAVALVAALCLAVLLWRLWLLHACFAPGAPAICAPVNPNPLWRYNRLYLPTDARLDSIAWGAMLALLEARGARLLASRAAIAGFVVLALSFALTGAWGRYGLRPAVQGMALLGICPWLVWQESPLRRLLCARPMLVLGRLSYSLYLWHWAALGCADFVAPAHGPLWLAVAVTLGAGLSVASYAGIERPMLRVRRRFGAHARMAWPGSLASTPARVADGGPMIERAQRATS